MDILKRLLNVITIGFVLGLTLLIFITFSEDSIATDNDFAPYLGLLGIGILVFNYIVFKKITLWHK